MHWLDMLMQFVSGVLMANGVPHFFHGIQGKKFQTPFASPPAVGESSALVNVLWGLANFILAAAALVSHWPAGKELAIGWLLFAIGAVISGGLLARYFARVRSPAR